MDGTLSLEDVKEQTVEVADLKAQQVSPRMSLESDFFHRAASSCHVERQHLTHDAQVFKRVSKWVASPQTRYLAIFELHQTEEKPSLTFSNTQLAALLKLAPQHLQRFAFNVSRATDTFFTTAASRFGKGLLQVILRLALLLLSNLTSPSVFSFR